MLEVLLASTRMRIATRAAASVQTPMLNGQNQSKHEYSAGVNAVLNPAGGCMKSLTPSYNGQVRPSPAPGWPKVTPVYAPLNPSPDSSIATAPFGSSPTQ